MLVLLFDVNVVFDPSSVVHCEDDNGFALVTQCPTAGPSLNRFPSFLLSVQSKVVTPVGKDGDVLSPNVVVEEAGTFPAGWFIDGGVGCIVIGGVFRVHQRVVG